MSYSSTLHIAIDSTGAEGSLKRLENRLELTDRAGDGAASSVSNVGLEADRMRNMVMRASGVISGSAAALGLMARQSSDAAREIKNLSRLAGADVVAFQKMTMASREFGIEQDQLAQIMLDVKDRVGDFLQTGQGEFADFFENIAPKVGLTADALARMAGPEALQAIYNALEQTNLTASETTFYMESLASDATRLIPLLQDNGAGFRAVADEAERLGVALSEIEIDQLTALRGEFADLETIISSSTSQIIAEYSGEITSTVDALGDGVRLLAENFDHLADVATLAAGVMTARFVSSMAAGTASIANSITVTRAHTAALAENRVAELARVATLARSVAEEKAAAAASAQAAAQRTALARAAIAQDAQRMASTQAALVAERALETQRLQAQISATGRMLAHTRLAEIRTSEIAVTNQLTAANVRLAEAEAAETATTRAATAASADKTRADTVATAAMGRYTGAVATASTANTAFAATSRAAAGALTLVGGPVGAAVIAGAGLYYFREELGLTDSKMQGTVDNVEELGSAFIDEFASLGTEIVGAFRGMRAEMIELDAGFLDLKAGALESFAGIVAGSADLINMGLIPIQHTLNALDQGFADWINRFAGAFESAGAMPFGMANLFGEQVSRMRSMADGLTEGLITPIGISTAALETNAQAWRDQADAMRGSADEVRAGVNPATRETADIFKTLDEWFLKAAKSTDEYTDSTADAAEKTYTLTDAYDSLLDRITPNRREARQYAQDLGVLNLALASGRMNTQQYMQAMGLLQESFQAAQRDTTEITEVTDVAADEMARAWEEATNRIDETFSDAFAGAFDSFDSFAGQLLDGFKRLLAELAYQATLKPIVVGFTGDMQSMMSGGGGGGFGNTISAARSLMSGSSLFGGAAAAPSLAMQGGLSSAALASAGQVAGGATYSGALGSAASGAALGNSVAGGFMSSVSAAMPWLAGGFAVDNILGLGITDGITKALGGLFGSSPTPFSGRFGTRDSAAPGTFEHQGSTTEQFYQQSALGAVGFLDDGTKRLQRAGTGNKEWAEELAAGAAEVDNLVASLAQSTPELNAMRTAVQGLETSSRSAADIVDFALNERPRAALEALGGDFGVFVRGLSGGIEEVVQQAQAGQQAHSVLATGMERLNLQFDSAGEGAYAAASNIAQWAGGVDQLTSLQGSYYQNYFAESERAAHLQADLTAEFARYGAQLPETREEFRRMVEAQDLNTEAGQRNYAALLQVAGSFDQLQQSALGADSVIGNTMGGVRSAWDDLNASIDAERQILDAAHQETTASIRSNMQTVRTAMQSAEQASQSLNNALRQTQSGTLYAREQGQAMLRSMLAAGEISDQRDLDNALAAVAEPSEGLFDTFLDYQRDQARTGHTIKDLEQLAGEQLTSEERSLRALEDQLTQADRQFDQEMARLDTLLAGHDALIEAEYGQLDWLETVNSSVLSLHDALAALSDARTGGGSSSSSRIGQGGTGAGGSVTDADITWTIDQVRDSAGGINDAAARRLYEAALNTGTPLDRIEQTIPGAIDWVERAGLPKFKDGGISDGPMSGYPVELHGREAVIPLQNGPLPLHIPGIDALLKEVAKLRSELRDSQRAIAEHTRKSARVLEREELERRQEEVV